MASNTSFQEHSATGTTGEDLGAALTSSMYCRLDDFGVLSAAGGDAASFLNSQFSSDITALHPGDAALTSYSDARGRVLAVPRVFAERERLLLVMPSERIEPVRGQLAKYVLRADVQLVDCSADLPCLAVSGEIAAAPLEEIAGELPAQPWGAVALPGGGVLARAPGARPRWLACGPAAAIAQLEQALEGKVVGTDPASWRLLEIEAGVPHVYAATAEHFVAQMLNLDRLGALDFRKGCYPGQEVIARTHYLGRIKRRMHILRGETGDAPASGTTVYAAGEAGGEIVDAAPHPDGGSLALAVLRLDTAAASLTLGAADGPPATAALPPYGFGDEG